MVIASRSLSYSRYTATDMTIMEKGVVREVPVTVYVNRKELVTFLCTPHNLRYLALGFLYLEGIIGGLDEVALLRVCDEEEMIEARLTHDVELPTRCVLTSGCGGGTTFADLTAQTGQIDSTLKVTPSQILGLMRRLYRQAELYRTTGGVHTSALSDGQQLLVVASDVGRHNTLDKIQGQCLLEGIDTRDRIILTTGRLSVEMLNKAAKMQAPVLVSRTSPTDLAVELAKSWGITLIGYARGGQIHVYSGEERVEPG
ncbi:MAG: formate dehydrogenase accessory sulfurtransferase FdhD [Anaerolineae bacterium]|nr:formate dehydrogenase accessory sulfurtransferase FdhD [Anaerolineae bacterium]